MVLKVILVIIGIVWNAYLAGMLIMLITDYLRSKSK